MERYEIWEPLPALPVFYECFARDVEDGLELLLETADSDGRVLLLQFKGHVPAYRQILEECRLTTYLRNDDHSAQLWKVINSKWLSDFGEADLIHYPNLNHYLIETGNQCFDVLLDTDPNVVWK